MDDLDDIKARVEHLPPEKQAELRTWFLDKDFKDWDAQIARDRKAGRLDALIDEAKADRDAGRAREL